MTCPQNNDYNNDNDDDDNDEVHQKYVCRCSYSKICGEF